MERYAIPVTLLEVPTDLAVGPVVFHPNAWLRSAFRRTLRQQDRPFNGRYDRRFLRPRIKQTEGWAVADVEATSLEEAAELVEGAISILRLYWRARRPYVSHRRQNFGLPGTLTRARRDYFGIDRTRKGNPWVTGTGWQNVGVLAGWEFTADDWDAFPTDAAFQVLANALRKPLLTRLPAEHRLDTTARLLGQASLASAPYLEVVLIAMAYEALLGDDSSDAQAHRIAQRVACRTCIGECGRSKPPCHYLTATSEKAARNEMYMLQRTGTSHGVCSAYWHTQELFKLRNRVLHSGEYRVEDDEASKLSWRADMTFLPILKQVATDGLTLFDDMNAKLAAFAKSSRKLARGQR